jgi:uncharacterized repeat protein (TIGR01451 family)
MFRRRGRTARQRLALLATVMVVPALAVLTGVPTSDAAAPPVAPNPPIEESCGVDLTVVLDASGSIESSHAVEDVRNAGDALLTALKNTNSTARVTQFATFAQQLAPQTQIDDTSMGNQGSLRKALNGYYNPKPPRPSTSNIYSYKGSGSPQSSSSFTLANSSNQYTNWDQSLDQAAQTTPELVLYVTDGDPTAYDFNHAGDPFTSKDVAVNTNRGAADALTLDRAIEEANRIKNQGSRMLAVGVGEALDNPDSANRLTQIAGPQVVRDADLANLDSLNDVDVALVTNFKQLAAFMRGVVIQLCSPSLTIQKLAQTADSSAYTPARNWDMTVTPTVPGGTFRWLLPNTTQAPSKTVSTDANGFAQFQWEPNPPENDSVADVAEALRPGYTAGRPGANNDFTCEFRDEDGNVRTVQGDFADPANPAFTLDPIAQEIGTCKLYNSYDYAPDIALTKVNSPTEVRGDLDPPAQVTSTFHVTNPGNTPLSAVTVVDDVCGPVAPVPPSGPNSGDTDGDGKLDPGESWLFRCAKGVSTSASTDPDGQKVVNTAEASGVDPVGTTVTDDANDEVDAFNPAISLTKLVDGADSVTIPAGQSVTYTYAVTNEGNTPLENVILSDDTPPCQNPTLDTNGNGDAVLDVGETWNYSCDLAAPTSSVVNTATVRATPRNPVSGNPFPAPNPLVRAVDTAEVQVVNPAIDLTKTATPDVILLGPGNPPPAEQVTYTFEATNTGDAPLNRPSATTGGAGTKDPGWVVDGRCDSPTTYVSGDGNGNDLLDPGETWQFTCQNTVDRLTVNVARITGQPSDADGNPLPVGRVRDFAAAVVRTLQPGISVTKTALVGVVLDEDIQPRPDRGPDAAASRPAQYTYDVVNTGNVPLSLGATRTENLSDDICSPVAYQSGDTNNDSLLDPDEVWRYTCETTLDRQSDSNTPPVGNSPISGLVTNRVDVTGVPFFEGGLVPGKSVADSDTAQVTVIEPHLAITKRASASVVRPDTDVTYTIRISNEGDVGLELQGLQDTKCGELELIRGDSDGNGLLNGADTGRPETWVYQCTRTLGMPTPPDTTDVNTVSVTGVDPLGNQYDVSDSATVTVIDPAIDLVKTVDKDLVPEGTQVTYGFDVTNVGQSPLASQDVLADILLRDVADPEQPSCEEPAYVSGDVNGDGLLPRDPPEVWHYECAATIERTTTDVAAVRGIGGTTLNPPTEIPVFDADAARVTVFHPGISVEKSADPTLLVGSGEVTYTYRVKNTGDVPLADVASRITDDTCSPLRYVSGDQDGDGLLDTPKSIFEDAVDETWVFRCRTTVSETTTNTVTVNGTPVDQDGHVLCDPACDVSDKDRATVRVVEPATITITKVTRQETDQRFPFTLGGAGFSLGNGDSKTFDDLAPGSYQLEEGDTDGWQLVTLDCRDPNGDTVVDSDAGTADIRVGQGETVTCTATNESTSTLPAGGTNPPPGGPGGLLPNTGAPALLWWILLGLALLVAGGAEIRYVRIRSRGEWS